MFKEPVHQILDKIKSKPYFKWLNKMGGDPTKRNQSLYCQYHQDHGHTIEDCKNLHDHLEQLVKAGKLKQFMHQPSRQGSQTGLVYQRESLSRPPLGTINVIFAALFQTRGYPFGVMSIARPHTEDQVPEFKQGRLEVRPTLGFLFLMKTRLRLINHITMP